MITDPASFAYNDPHQGKGTEYPQLVHPESNEGKDWQANVCAYITELFEWNVTEVAEGWQRKFQLLCAFQRDKGHCRVPKNLVVDSVKLGQWVSSQRRYYRNRIGGRPVRIHQSLRSVLLSTIQMDSSGQWPKEQSWARKDGNKTYNCCAHFSTTRTLSCSASILWSTR